MFYKQNHLKFHYEFIFLGLKFSSWRFLFHFDISLFPISVQICAFHQELFILKFFSYPAFSNCYLFHSNDFCMLSYFCMNLFDSFGQIRRKKMERKNMKNKNKTAGCLFGIVQRALAESTTSKCATFLRVDCYHIA